MELDFNWINLLILFGALQALLFSIILLFNKTHPGSRFLSIFVFVLAYNGFETFNWSSGLDQYHLFFDMFSYVVIYALGPGLYLYVSSLLDPSKKFSKKAIAFHFGLVILQFVSRILIIVYHILWINKIIISDISSNDLINVFWFLAEPISVLMFVAYLGITIFKFRNFNRNKKVIPSLYPEAQVSVIKWIKSLLISLSVFAIIWVMTVISPYVLTTSFSHYYPIELFLVFFIYWTVLNGYHKMKLIYLPTRRPGDFPPTLIQTLSPAQRLAPEIFAPPEQPNSALLPNSSSLLNSSPLPNSLPTNSSLPTNPSFTQSLPDSPGEIGNGAGHQAIFSKVQEPIPDQDKYFSLIKDAMEQAKLYLDPELNLSKLSAHTAIPAKQISAILNQYQDTNFNDFINSYRVTQVSLLMMNPSTRNLTISSLAMDAGFNSQATFQRAFKKHTGMSPRQFIARSLKRSA